MPFFASSYNTWLPNLWSSNKTNYTFLKLLFLPNVQLIIECCCFSSSISLSKRYSRKLFFPRKQKSIRTYKSTIYAIPSCFYYRRTIPALIYYEISFSNFQTCMPEGLLPEVPRSVLQYLKESIWMEKVSSTLEVGRGNQVQHSFLLPRQTGIITTPILNALQKGCVRFWTDYFTASQITFTSPGSSLLHSRCFIASLCLFQITFRLPPMLIPRQTLTPLY